ncbi:hypothetical protein PP707_07755, partial [Acetobacter pasteurianus]|nr:hypothetical protein [Acetobacter pasteurianus]
MLPISTSQTFYLKDSLSSIVVQPLSTPATFTVVGFGNNNKIGISIPLLSAPYLGLTAYSYDSGTGTLTLRGLSLGLLSQKFVIGTGYDSSKFKIVTDSGAGLPTTLLGSVQYNGPVPNQSVPAVCQCQVPPDAPGTDLTSSTQPPSYSTEPPTSEPITSESPSSTESYTPTNSESSTDSSAFTTEYTTTWTTTNADGSVETDSGVVSVSGTSSTTVTTFAPESSTDTDSESSTDSSAFTTEYTTTWTTTNADGSVETDSGVVSVSGTSSTTVTTFPHLQDAGASEYTTTWTTTNADGSVETDSGIV